MSQNPNKNTVIDAMIKKAEKAAKRASKAAKKAKKASKEAKSAEKSVSKTAKKVSKDSKKAENTLKVYSELKAKKAVLKKQMQKKVRVQPDMGSKES